MSTSQHPKIAASRITLEAGARSVMTAAVILILFGAIGWVVAQMTTPHAVDAPTHTTDGHSAAGHETTAATHGAGGTAADDHHHSVGHIAHESAWQHSYLLNLCFFLSLSLGALFFLLIQHLTKAGWSVAVRRIAECIAMNIVVVALLFIPVLLPSNIHELYQWSHTAEVRAANDQLILLKASYLNYEFFLTRSLIFFGIWIALAYYFRAQSVRQDATGDQRHTLNMQRVAPIGMMLFALSITFAAFDYLMSLDAHWFSTIFGVYYLAGSFMSFMGLLAITLYLLQKSGYLKESVTREHYHDVGKLMFAFVVFWTYVAFSQYMLIWYGNMPEETGWYLRRQAAGSGWMSASLAFFAVHFFVPFFFLLSRHIKRNKNALVLGAGWVIAVHWCDMYYLIMPQVRSTPAPKLLDFSILLLMAGIYCVGLGFWLKRSNLVAVRDPRLAESLAFENY
ncbi:MAG: quinol:cytochrome C oxidoreductase [Planctomycetota bacterium]